MKAAQCGLAAFAIAMATTAHAVDDERGGRRVSPAVKPPWEFALTAYPTVVRGGENYTSAIATADHGPLHLEARYNYESVGARSAFVGWNLSGGEEVKWELTPMLGGAWGTTQAFVPALEASASWKQFDASASATMRRGLGLRSTRQPTRATGRASVRLEAAFPRGLSRPTKS